MSNCRYTPETEVPGPGLECRECGEEYLPEEVYEVDGTYICVYCLGGNFGE